MDALISSPSIIPLPVMLGSFLALTVIGVKRFSVTGLVDPGIAASAKASVEAAPLARQALGKVEDHRVELDLMREQVGQVAQAANRRPKRRSRRKAPAAA